MDSFGFGGFLSSNLGLDETDVNQLLDHCNRKTFSTNEYLLRTGEKSRYTYYVEKGLLRKYGINKEGKEAILQFAPEKWFVSDRESLFFKRPSLYNIQALETTQVLLLDDDLFNEIAEKLPDFTEFNNRLLHNHIHQLSNRIYSLLSQSAEERYLDFIQTYPDILLRVPQWMVASYLGITPESLSRVRKKLANNNFKPS